MAKPKTTAVPPPPPLEETGVMKHDAAGAVQDNPIPEAFQHAFLANRVRFATEQLRASLNLHPERFNELVGAIGNLSFDQNPVPGGVGYGTFFKPQFQTAFVSGTDILWSAVCPPSPGGNVNSVLYVTATNRSARGVEALLAYDPGQGPAFRIYDWSIPQSPPGGADGRWVKNLAGAALQPYILPTPLGGQSLPCLHIWNSTIKVGPGSWQNNVFLYSSAGQWVGQYSRIYAAQLADHHQANLGNWGPIVETFQPHFAGTVSLGAVGVQLRNRSGPAWTPWSPLSPAQSEIRDDQVGFVQIHLDANYDWLVSS